MGDTEGQPETGSMERIAVIGAGAWGTALAAACRRAGRRVTLWAREPDVAEAITTQHENTRFLPGVSLDRAITATSDLTQAVTDAEVLLLVTPAQHLRTLSNHLTAADRPPIPAVICAKGIEAGTEKRMTEVAAEALPGWPVAVLSGPTFAAEVARGQPTAVTLACIDQALGARLVAALGSRTFRPYLSTDPIGVELGGAIKNVLAIACGVVMGRSLGDNARAALITRGLAEIARLGAALGARPETFMGLSGLGDLTLTCTSLQSRNASLGYALGQGQSLSAILAQRQSVAEGVYTAAVTVALGDRLGVDMPICRAVDTILNRGADLEETIATLLARPFREERVVG